MLNRHFKYGKWTWNWDTSPQTPKIYSWVMIFVDKCPNFMSTYWVQKPFLSSLGNVKFREVTMTALFFGLLALLCCVTALDWCDGTSLVALHHHITHRLQQSAPRGDTANPLHISPTIVDSQHHYCSIVLYTELYSHQFIVSKTSNIYIYISGV